MGYVRQRPARLADKLRQIREGLGLSQGEMLRRLEAEDKVALSQISQYETGSREPSLLLLLQYARVAGIHMEALVDDDIDLPERLPGPVKFEEIKRTYSTRSRGKSRR